MTGKPGGRLLAHCRQTVEDTGAETYYRRTLSLPLFPAMEDADVDRVAVVLKAALRISK